MRRLRWLQFSLRRLLIVLGCGPPLLAGAYFLFRDAGLTALIVIPPLVVFAVFVDLISNPFLSRRDKVVWLMMMLVSCWTGFVLYVAVRIYGWLFRDSLDLRGRQSGPPTG
jgi:hypothetical protein